MALIRLGRFVPKTLREWDRVFESLNLIGTPGQVEVTNPGGDDPVTIALAETGTAGAYAKVTVDSTGRVTGGASSLGLDDIPAGIARDTEVTAAIDTHKAETDPHPDLIDDLTAASSVALADQVVVSQSGTNKRATVTQLKAAVFGDDWDDLRFPMNSVDPAGLAAPATRVTSTTGYTGALSFAGNAENVCAGIAQMPHAWKRGTAIKPHIHWTKPTGSADAVTWELYYRIVGNPGDVVGAWVGPVSPTGTIGDQTTNDEHLLTYWPEISMTGLIESAIVYWRLHRQGATDADSSAVICHELDFHYQTDKAGTDSEIPTE